MNRMAQSQLEDLCAELENLNRRADEVALKIIRKREEERKLAGD